MTDQEYAAAAFVGTVGDSVAEQTTVTGQVAIDAALRTLASVSAADPADQLPAFQATHRTLRETLASIDEEG
ncbi:hypothetical protein JQS43_12725 [Natronosporangium hydrolyticum]|uniref:Uncharacterized protein n=1 Tax=Natronosporangium hydrolyticum TaxID=2811111 RepID=A0A895YI29_9ACTN|nr:hypothetical protein [Natronosporangium hydrolyticum]QSB17584.1 hypothetical protein JQS43_12725 [Natronosporangium hydrolyticum]